MHGVVSDVPVPWDEGPVEIQSQKRSFRNEETDFGFLQDSEVFKKARSLKISLPSCSASKPTTAGTLYA